MPTPDQIRPAKKKAEADLMKRDGVCGVDIGKKIVGGKKTDQLAIRVYVEKKGDVDPDQAIPAEIDGFATDVIELTFKLHALVPAMDVAPRVDATRYSTLRGGMSIGPCRTIFKEPPEVPAPGNYIIVGTLGALVADNSSGDRMMLTNFHVAAADDTWSPGDDIAQPSRPDGGACPGDTVGELQRAVVSGTTAGGNPGVDGAVVSIAGRPHECSIIGIGDVQGTATAADGMAVRKRGRTTELTHGTVDSTDLTVTVPYFDGIGDVTFEDQILIEVDDTVSTVFGLGGDSGSVVVNDSERVVGLYFAGNNEVRDADGNVTMPEGVIGIANPIAAVEAALDVTICTPPVIKKIEKEGKDFLPKEFKEFHKEFKDFGPKEFKEFGPKELKEFAPKEFKEFKEPKEIFEFPGQGPGFPFGGAFAPAGGGRDCIEFDKMKPQPVPNPATFGAATFSFFDHAGNPWPTPGIKSMGAFVGLDTGFRTDIKLGKPCRQVEISLVHFSQPVKVEAYDAAGTLIGTAAMSGPQGVAETLTLGGVITPGGGSIHSLVVVAPQNEALILRFCCVEPKGGEDECVEFQSMRPQAVPNPATFGGASYRFLDHAGNPWPNPGVKNFGSFVGLDVGFRTEIKFERPCRVVEITLVHFSSPAKVEAYDSSGALVDTAAMSGPQSTPETLTLSGDIAGLVVIAPQDETLILRLCCRPDGPKPPKPEKPEKQEKPEKEEKVEKPEKIEKPEKREKPEKLEKPEKFEKPEKIEKIEKPEKREKPEKLEKPEKNEKIEKPEKLEKPEKIEKFEKPEKREKPEKPEKEGKEPKELKEPGPKELKEPGPKELKEPGPKELKEPGPKELKEPGPKELKEPGPKELKEPGPKELKEPGPKEFKERGPKELKEQGPKELKETGLKENKEPKEIVEKPTDGGGGPGFPSGPIDDRLGRLEAAVQQLTHFITQALRPDLSAGALKQEPDYAGGQGQDLHKQATDAKQAKDSKDNKESDA